MATIQKYQRSKGDKASVQAMLNYLKELESPKESYPEICVTASRNHNCEGKTTKDFGKAVETTQINYLRRKKILGGKRSPILWDEVIHNLGKGCFITEQERIAIEQEFVEKLCRDAPARTLWSINRKTGQCVLYILFSAKRPCGVMTLERTNIGLSKRLQNMDQFAADMLNNNPKKPSCRKPNIQTAKSRQEQKTKGEPLSKQIAREANRLGIEDVEEHHLIVLFKNVDLKIIKITESTIKYESTRRKLVEGNRVPRKGTVHISDFLLDVLNDQVDLKITE
jgi:hypothetical protein